MYDMEIPRCELCGSKNEVVIYDKNEIAKKRKLLGVVLYNQDKSIIHGRNVVCVNCGLSYITPRMTEKRLDHFYKIDYRKAYPSHGDTKNIHSVNAIQYLKNNNVTGSLIDIGCSDGSLPRKYRELTGEYVEGVEKTHNEYDFKVSSDIELVTEKFDIATILNTLEHIHSPRSFIKKVRKILKPNGKILITVPNLYNNFLNIHLDGFFSNAHIYNFSIKTIVELVTISGFEVIAADLVNESIGSKIYLLAKHSENINNSISKFGEEAVKHLLARIEATKVLQCITK